jgi:hypothetical protein
MLYFIIHLYLIPFAFNSFVFIIFYKINFYIDTKIMVPNIQKCLFRTFSDECLTKCVISNHVSRHEKVNIKRTQDETNKLRKMYEFEERLHVPKLFRYTAFKNNLRQFGLKKPLFEYEIKSI